MEVFLEEGPKSPVRRSHREFYYHKTSGGVRGIWLITQISAQGKKMVGSETPGIKAVSGFNQT